MIVPFVQMKGWRWNTRGDAFTWSERGPIPAKTVPDSLVGQSFVIGGIVGRYIRQYMILKGNAALWMLGMWCVPVT